MKTGLVLEGGAMRGMFTAGVLDVLMEVLEKGAFIHQVLGQALYKYQYLDKSDRAFITRAAEGTLDYLIQIDYIIEKYSSVKIRNR